MLNGVDQGSKLSGGQVVKACAHVFKRNDILHEIATCAKFNYSAPTAWVRQAEADLAARAAPAAGRARPRGPANRGGFRSVGSAAARSTHATCQAGPATPPRQAAAAAARKATARRQAAENDELELEEQQQEQGLLLDAGTVEHAELRHSIQSKVSTQL